MAKLSEKTSAETSQDSDLDLLIADLLARLDRNEAIDIPKFIASHPAHAEELRRFFSFSQDLSDMMRPEPDLAKTSVFDQAQRSTTSIDSQTLAMLSSEASPASPDPRKIGKYEIFELIGAGSFGRVYQGYDPLAKRQVAIKVPRTWSDVSEEKRDAFLHEAQSAAALRHEHIVRLLDVYQGSDAPIALIYEHISGPSMSAVLKQKDYQRPEAVLWVAEIADALDYAHRNGIVHRDVKPSNILITQANGRREPRIVDFGLALLDNQFWHKGDRSRVGAIRYMSPEQAKCNSHWATSQSDVFSLGVMLYEVLCGRSPWTGTSDTEMLREIEERDPAPPRVMDGTISPALERICLKAMAKSPSERYTTAGDMARDLRATARAPRPKWQSWKSLAAAAAVLLVAGAIIFSNHSNSEATAGAGTIEPEASPRLDKQEVQLSLKIQPLGKPGSSLLFNDEVDHVVSGDRLQINVQIPKAGYLYVLWYRPNGEAHLSEESDLATARLAIQDPPVDEKTPWAEIGQGGAGKHLVVAFTRTTPLRADEVETLKHTPWQTTTDWLGNRTIFRTGYPRMIEGPTRGGVAHQGPSDAEVDQYLGKLGTLLKQDWKCYYQAVVFRVN
ncbi:MAG TPA: serine/threonine-protein kinase [Lacipirellulaceae bacterium]|jgi:serine/threonine protein kinase|nr:serine/threonine-protein kinase [Lacipirellulaceae bacterium]